MSQAKATVTPTEVVQFVTENAKPNSKWIPESEIVWVLSWYGDADTSRVRQALDAAVSRNEIVAERDRYTVPALL